MGFRVVCAVALWTIIGHANASTFLQAHPAASISDIARDNVQTLLSSELTFKVGSVINALEEELRPMYTALPKGAHGKLDPPVVRYALHRHFARKYGWSMQGLQPQAGDRNASVLDTILVDKVPSYILDLLMQWSHSDGLGLSELTAFAATLTDLVHKEAIEHLHNIYTAMKLPMKSSTEMDVLIRNYLVVYILGDGSQGLSRSGLAAKERDLASAYPSWRSVKLWAKDTIANFRHVEERRNPFYVADYSFSQAKLLVQEVGHSFGSFQNLECRGLKDALTSIEAHGTGRIPLSNFYTVGLQGDWKLTESIDYLRSLGSLDESDPASASVLIPNYLHSQANCLSASQFYSVCCMNECEELMAHVEEVITLPTAFPENIVHVVSRLPSDTVDAPRNISKAHMDRLHDIAKFHGGMVPLHGRLFAQWMHHAYPRECPFPHVSGSVSSMTREQFEAKSGVEDAEATEAEMFILAAPQQELEVMTAEQKFEALPWVDVEELVTKGQHSLGPSPHCVRSWFRSVAITGLLMSVMVSLFRTSSKTAASVTDFPGSKSERHLV